MKSSINWANLLPTVVRGRRLLMCFTLLSRFKSSNIMAEHFLSQEEVDALMRSVTGEKDDEKVVEESPGTVRDYNLAAQERIVRGRMPTLEIINERFASLLRIGLFNFLHSTAEISVGPV